MLAKNTEDSKIQYKGKMHVLHKLQPGNLCSKDC